MEGAPPPAPPHRKQRLDADCLQRLRGLGTMLPVPCASLRHSPALCKGTSPTCVSVTRAGSLVRDLAPPAAHSLMVHRVLGEGTKLT